MITLYPHQQDSVAKVYKSWSDETKNILLVEPTGAGKCLGENTPVLLFNGQIKKSQDIIVGDELMGDDSEPRLVKSITEGVEMLYRVTPVKGDSYIVNESHILSLKKTGTYEVVNINVKDYLSKSKYFKHIHKGWRTNVSWGESKLDKYIPPYMLGVWLGDGTTSGSSITTADQEIVDYIYEYANEMKLGVTKYVQPENKSSVYNITNNRLRSDSLRASLRSLNLLNNKHIPLQYKTGSDEQRLQLLAGILDSDGHLAKKYYDVIFKVKTLAYDLAFIARSLGFACYVKKCKKTCYNNGVIGDYYRLSISGDVSRIPTRLKRHESKPRLQKKSVLVTGIKVEPIGVGKYYGFEITGNRLFLLGDFTVTHNTFIKSQFARDAVNSSSVTIIFAHRDILLSQISLSLAKMGVYHSFIAVPKTIKDITDEHLAELGESFYDQTSNIMVASVPTYARRLDKGVLDNLIPLVKLWMLDETHHLLDDNVFGKCVNSLVNARGLGVTATPLRADGKGLGRGHKVYDSEGKITSTTNDGVFDKMIVGSKMGDLIQNGFLSPYKIYVPPQKLNVEGIKITATGDYNQKKLAERTDTVDITGDAVTQYLNLAEGKQAIAFCVDINHSDHVAQAFNKAGITAASLSSKTNATVRNRQIQEFKRGEIKVLVNCMLFDEGFDVPAVACVIMLRKTDSYGLFKQQFGRLLRVISGKDYGILIDHVGNVKRHCFYGEPHDDPVWSLERTKNIRGDDEKPQGRICPECFAFYIPTIKAKFQCAECSHEETDQQTIAVDQEYLFEDENLVEMPVSFINDLLIKRKKVDKEPEEVRRNLTNGGASNIVINSAVNNHTKRKFAQERLRRAINIWCAECELDQPDWDIRTIQLNFKREFGIDILNAQILSERKSLELLTKIEME